MRGEGTASAADDAEIVRALPGADGAPSPALPEAPSGDPVIASVSSAAPQAPPGHSNGAESSVESWSPPESSAMPESSAAPQAPPPGSSAASNAAPQAPPHGSSAMPESSAAPQAPNAAPQAPPQAPSAAPQAPAPQAPDEEERDEAVRAEAQALVDSLLGGAPRAPSPPPVDPARPRFDPALDAAAPLRHDAAAGADGAPPPTPPDLPDEFLSGEPRAEGAAPADTAAVEAALREIFDPEIPVNIHDLGLIYDIEADGRGTEIVMTLTAPGCPVAGILPQQVADGAAAVPGAGRVRVRLTWDPPWDFSRMSDDARVALGFID